MYKLKRLKTKIGKKIWRYKVLVDCVVLVSPGGKEYKIGRYLVNAS